MTDERHQVPRGDELPREIQRDMMAFREATARDLPELALDVTPVRHRVRAGLTWKERLMNNRPWFATAAVAGIFVIASLVVPFSYEKVTGHDLTLSLSGTQDMAQVQAIAKELKAAVHAGGVQVRMENQNGALTYVFTARVPASAGIDAAAVGHTFASQLEERGFTASAQATPVREKVSGNVYAYARDVVVRVEMSGKNASQIEAEIRQQLAAAGITNTQVNVVDEAGQRKVTVEAQSTGSDPNVEHPNLQLELTKDGQVMPPGDGQSIEVRKLKTDTGMNLEMTFKKDGRSTQATVPNVDRMSDADLAAALQSQLVAAGFNVNVKVEGGKISIEPRK